MSKVNNKFEKILPLVVPSILSTIRESHASNDWSSATYSYLKSSDGNTGIFKLRIRLVSGDVDASLDPERSTRRLIADTWERMFKTDKSIWYGMKLTVYPDGKHEVEYNYDPNCIDDPNFVDF